MRALIAFVAAAFTGSLTAFAIAGVLAVTGWNSTPDWVLVPWACFAVIVGALVYLTVEF